MSKIYDALTRSLLEHYPVDWLTQLGLIHGEPVARHRLQPLVGDRRGRQGDPC